jgi:hypothetical protein
LAAAIVMFTGVLLSYRQWRTWLSGYKSALWQIIILAMLTLLFTAINRGFALFDDFQNLPMTSLLATGEIPPRFALNPSLQFGYHYFMLLLGAQFMRIGSFFVWNALDLARGFTFSLVIMLGGLWAWRLTQSRWTSLFSAVFLTFSSGIRWVLLFFPIQFLQAMSTHITLSQSGVAEGTPLAQALYMPVNFDGSGPVPFPFAFMSGINLPVTMSFDGRGTVWMVIIITLLLTATRWRNRFAPLVTTILFASLAFAEEINYLIVILGFGIVVLWWLLTYKNFHLPKKLWVWIGVVSASVFFAFVQGGPYSDILLGLLKPVVQERSSYYSFTFQFLYPPAFVSHQLGVLPVSDPYLLLLGLLEIGPVILMLPFLISRTITIFREENWWESSMLAGAVISILTIFVLYTGTGGERNTSRFIQLLLFSCKLYAIPLLWITLSSRPKVLMVLATLIAAVAIISGVVLFSVEVMAIPHPVFSNFLNISDARMTGRFWDKFDKSALVFDPNPSRAVTVFGRYTDSSFSWYQARPEWEELVKAPDPYLLKAAGFDYAYIDKQYFENLPVIFQEKFSDPCVMLLKTYESLRGEGTSREDFTSDYRQIYDISRCK